MRGDEVRAVGVVGCGLMGSGIVEVAARAGQRVVYLESDDDLVEAGRSRIEVSTLRAVERNRLTDEARDDVLGRVVGTTDIADLAAATKRPELVLGLHFFNPVPVMGLVEIVKAISTSDETVEFGRAYCVSLGKTTVLSRDRAGFIVNTLLIPYLNDAVRMLEEGFATREDVDTAIHLGLNHPMGPLRLADLIGLDTCLQIANVLYDEFKEPRYAPPPLLKRMVTAGHLGRKTGRGFYEYEG
jgi:3-hydroxybutyryl-CoA dehydrogenase